MSTDGEAADSQVIVESNSHNDMKAKFPSNFIVTSQYTWWNFIPLNLFHQFRKVQNFYFLVNMIFAVIPGVSPISPASSILPLIFVVGVAMLKDAYEDWQRHKNDDRANSAKTHVGRVNDSGKPELMEVSSKDVCVGDYIYLKNGEEVRADVLLLWTPAAEGAGFIDTCNLDGETNLKGRKALDGTCHMNSLEACCATKVAVTTNVPDPNLHDWAGTIDIDDGRGQPRNEAVGIDQFLYRSCILKNTETAWGVVLYAGVDTKMFKNLAKKAFKQSNLDKKMNNLIIVIFIFQTIALICMASYAVAWNNAHKHEWYLDQLLHEFPTLEIRWYMWFFRYMSYFILMSYLIPISLFVTIELCKVAQAKIMTWDHEMFEWMYGKWVHCNPNTSDLNEQLAQVRFIFSDKTGTLTENKMIYKQGDALGKPIHSEDWQVSRDYLKNPSAAADVTRYCNALALCHTIQPFRHEDRPDDPIDRKYDGASPDEIALVQTAKEHDFILLERTTKTMELLVGGNKMKYDIMATLEFTPDRKMMSIIVRDPDGKIQLFTKGADSFVIPNLDKAAAARDLPPLVKELEGMGQLGLRTLIVCGKTITQQEFDEWFQRFSQAGKSLQNRSQKVDEVCLEMEKGMDIIGCTAIEDKLQDQVPETLQFFLQAGVVVWMLTGDKRETAVTIAATSSLADPDGDYILHVDIGSLDPKSDEAIKVVGDQLTDIGNAVARGDKKATFVIDGVALDVAQKHHTAQFIDVAQKVNSAVCCRLTPLQKARVVDMFQTQTGLTALAIGDGANDVSMIQKGRVGVGIMGLEGAQAALSADYAIPRFKHLKRLCAVHGRYAQVRNALCINFSFYKNICLALMQFYYCWFNGASGTSLIDGWLLTFFNVAFTVLPPLALGFFEKDVTERALMNEPALFPDLAAGLYFDGPTLARWFGQSILHSLVIFFSLHSLQYRQDILGETVGDYIMHGNVVITATIFVVLIKLVLHIRYWQSIMVTSIVLSFVFFFGFILIYAAIPDAWQRFTSFYWTPYILFQEPKYWLYTLLLVAGLLLPFDMCIIFVQRQIFPTIHDEMQEEYEYGRYSEKNIQASVA